MNYRTFFRFKLLLSFFTILFSSNLFAQEDKPYTNILTWWGYLDNVPKEMISEIEKKCNTTISYDTYYSNDDFTKRFKDSKYDVVIFSDTIYKTIDKKIDIKNSKLYTQSVRYNKTIKNQYDKSKFDHNVVYFVHSLTGFLYNPDVIKISDKEDLKKIFKDVGDNVVVMIDDPLEANILMGLLLKDDTKYFSNFAQNENYLTLENFKNIFQNSHFIITNTPEKASSSKDFAFAFQWSGDAMSLMKESNNHLKFLVHPKLSYVSTDLLAELNTEKTTTCISRELSSKKFLSYLQNKTHYLSPYGDNSSISDPEFKNFHSKIFKILPFLPWISPLSQEKLRELKKSWELIMINVNLEEQESDDN